MTSALAEQGNEDRGFQLAVTLGDGRPHGDAQSAEVMGLRVGGVPLESPPERPLWAMAWEKLGTSVDFFHGIAFPSPRQGRQGHMFLGDTHSLPFPPDLPQSAHSGSMGHVAWPREGRAVKRPFKM